MIARAALAAAFAFGIATSADAACRQALALGLDESGSVDTSEYRLQIDGLAAALEAPDVVERLLAMPSAPVRLAVFDWSSTERQRVILPWREVRTRSDVAQIAAQLRSTKRATLIAERAASSATALGTAMVFGTDLLDAQRSCWKQTLDISGDGKNNTGVPPQRAQIPREITINGLVVGADNPATGDARQVEIGELSSYYRAYVIRGRDAFVETALGFDDFERAMTRKLIRELEGLVLGQVHP